MQVQENLARSAGDKRCRTKRDVSSSRSLNGFITILLHERQLVT